MKLIVTKMSGHTFYTRSKNSERIDTVLWAVSDIHGNTMYQVYSKTKPDVDN